MLRLARLSHAVKSSLVVSLFMFYSKFMGLCDCCSPIFITQRIPFMFPCSLELAGPYSHE